MSRNHAPAPEFRAALEDALTKELRRGAPPISIVRRPRARLRTAAIVTAALAVGALAGALPAQVKDARNRSALLRAVESDERLAAIQYELAGQLIEDARKKLEVGATGRESFASAVAHLAAMEAQLERIRLNRQEIEATSSPPRDDLSAPAVGGRDFVGERLRLDLRSIQERLLLFERAEEHALRLQRVGASLPSPVIDAQTDLAVARSMVKSITERIALRKEFVAGRLSIEQVERGGHQVQLRSGLEIARAMHKRAEQKLAHLRRLHEAGQAEQLEVMRAEVEVLERAAEIKQIEARATLMGNPSGKD